MAIKSHQVFKMTCVAANQLNIPYSCVAIVMLSIANYYNFF